MALTTPDGTCEVLIPRDRYDPFEVLAIVNEWEREDPEPGPPLVAGVHHRARRPDRRGRYALGLDPRRVHSLRGALPRPWVHRDADLLPKPRAATCLIRSKS
jgi:hypothetical protein